MYCSRRITLNAAKITRITKATIQNQWALAVEPSLLIILLKYCMEAINPVVLVILSAVDSLLEEVVKKKE